MIDRKILLLGGTGTLGRDFINLFESKGVEYFAPNKTELNMAPNPKFDEKVTFLDQLSKLYDNFQFNQVINCAAFTYVDGCEDIRNHIDFNLPLNSTSPGKLAQFCKEKNAKLVHFSTDYVFDGLRKSPYTEKSYPNPINYYGRAKLSGEQKISFVNGEYTIIRTSWLFGNSGRGFPQKILHKYISGEKLEVIKDQIGTPTFSKALTKAVWSDIVQERQGLLHLTHGQALSWHEFALKIIEKYQQLYGGKIRRPLAVPSHKYFTIAPRPMYSALDSKVIPMAGIMPELDQSIEEFITNMSSDDN
jgi:dTDP-4-dehydrorhamnose reductase